MNLWGVAMCQSDSLMVCKYNCKECLIQQIVRANILCYFMERNFCTCINVNVSVNIFYLYIGQSSFYKYKSFNSFFDKSTMNYPTVPSGYSLQRGNYTKTLRRKSKLTRSEMRRQFIHAETFKPVFSC